MTFKENVNIFEAVGESFAVSYMYKLKAVISEMKKYPYKVIRDDVSNFKSKVYKTIVNPIPHLLETGIITREEAFKDSISITSGFVLGFNKRRNEILRLEKMYEEEVESNLHFRKLKDEGRIKKAHLKHGYIVKKRGEIKMNDWLNYEGSGSSLSHGFDLGYGYDYGTTRHGSVLVHADKQLAGGVYAVSSPKVPSSAQQGVIQSKWKVQGSSDMKKVVDQALHLWELKKYKELANYCEIIGQQMLDLQSGRKNTGIGPSRNTAIPMEAKNSYTVGYNRYYDMFEKIRNRAHQLSDKLLNGKPNPYLLNFGN